MRNASLALIAVFGISIGLIGCQQGTTDGGTTGAETTGTTTSTGTTTTGTTGDPAGTTGGGAATTASFADAHTIIVAKCSQCHGENGKDGIDVRTYESLMKGGSHGPIIVAGDAAGSKLVKALRGADGVKQMPFKQAPLSPEEIAKIEEWINAGAKQ